MDSKTESEKVYYEVGERVIKKKDSKAKRGNMSLKDMLSCFEDRNETASRCFYITTVFFLFTLIISFGFIKNIVSVIGYEYWQTILSTMIFFWMIAKFKMTDVCHYEISNFTKIFNVLTLGFSVIYFDFFTSLFYFHFWVVYLIMISDCELLFLVISDLFPKHKYDLRGERVY